MPDREPTHIDILAMAIQAHTASTYGPDAFDRQEAQDVATSGVAALRREGYVVVHESEIPDTAAGMAAGPQATPDQPTMLDVLCECGHKSAEHSTRMGCHHPLEAGPCHCRRFVSTGVVAVPTDREDPGEPTSPEDGEPWTPLSDAVRRSRGGPPPRRPGGFA